ncbi:hypothetical protein F220043C3_16210 [Enterocloster asparagiformis]|uniref:hypothetical protein n=1 Tax=Enterocloster asparagiformis TaxID=333367 RepID=UPI0034B4937F
MNEGYNTDYIPGQPQPLAMYQSNSVTQTQYPMINQPVPVPSPPVQNYPSNVGVVDQAYYQKSCLIQEQAQADIHRHLIKREIDEEHLAHMMKCKSDIQIKREQLSDKIIITEDGGIVRKQEYLLEKPREYSFTNFKIAERPVKYKNEDKNATIFCLSVMLQNQRSEKIYIDLERGSGGYCLKKFLSAGITFRKRRNERKEFIFDILQAIGEIAEVVVLPQFRGFYRSEDGILNYAGRADLTWKDVVEYAK